MTTEENALEELRGKARVVSLALVDRDAGSRELVAKAIEDGGLASVATALVDKPKHELFRAAQITELLLEIAPDGESREYLHQMPRPRLADMLGTRPFGDIAWRLAPLRVVIAAVLKAVYDHLPEPKLGKLKRTDPEPILKGAAPLDVEPINDGDDADDGTGDDFDGLDAGIEAIAEVLDLLTEEPNDSPTNIESPRDPLDASLPGPVLCAFMEEVHDYFQELFYGNPPVRYDLGAVQELLRTVSDECRRFMANCLEPAPLDEIGRHPMFSDPLLAGTRNEHVEGWLVELLEPSKQPESASATPMPATPIPPPVPQGQSTPDL